MKMVRKNKVFVFGIDGAPPELIFDKWLPELPNIKKLMSQGCYAKINSTIPPATIIAWNAMLSGKDASEIGVFNYTYKDETGKSRIVDSNRVKCDLIWDVLRKKDKKSVSLFVPLTYPVKPINGCQVGGFLTPGLNGEFAYPEKIKEKIRNSKNPEIFFDVAVGLAGHKGMELDKLIEKTYEMTDMQLELTHDLLENEDWDFFISVMIGTDRLQHMVWRHFDETHRRFIADSPHKDSLKNYYKYLDKKLGEILEKLDEDTTIIVTSDHGMVKQEGKININNWLIEQGYLKLKDGIDLSEKKRFSNDFIDMENTVAWGGGAYNARVYINKNKVGQNYEKIRQELIEKLKAIADDNGKPLDTKVYKSEEIYSDTASSECPDLTVYFGDLRWASNPDLGQPGLYSWETALGADSAGHSRQGSFIIAGNQISNKGNIGEIDIRQVMPTILNLLKVKIPEDIKVKPFDCLEDNYYESSLIDATEGMQFKVYSNSHPKDFVIAKPKYIPENLMQFVGMKKRFMFEKCMNRFNLFTKKEFVEENLKRLKEKFPELIYECDKHDNWFLGVPKNKIKKAHDTRLGLQEFMRVPDSDLDEYLGAVRGIINLIAESGVPIKDLGISHSTLLGNYTPGKSDIDILVFGKENGWKVIEHLEKTNHPDLKWKSEDDWANYYEDRVVSDQYSKEEYVFNMVRKKDDGYFRGHVFSIFVVEDEKDSWYDWEDQREPVGTVKIKAKVTDDQNSIVRPGYYGISEVEILEGLEKELSSLIKRIVVWARPFVLQAKKGEKVEACGLLERVKTKEGEFHQIVLGYFDTYTTERGKKEYLKALLE